MTTPTIEEVLAQRGKSHGDWTEQAASTQHIKEILRCGTAYDTMTSAQKEGLDMIAHKMARIVTGDPNEPDHWFDIEGYARITRERLYP
jgi:hypothetical protein